jgi:hypothetical protein
LLRAEVLNRINSAKTGYNCYLSWSAIWKVVTVEIWKKTL